MDETPIKAGRDGPGKLKPTWYWPLYGDAAELSFTWSETRGSAHVKAQLKGFAGTLLTDGYRAYDAFAQDKPEITQANCWAHCRRYFERASDGEPAAQQALELIGALYEVEKAIRDRKLAGEAKLEYRSRHAQPVVEAFFGWCHDQRQRLDLVNSAPFAKALVYADSRQAELRVYLGDPDVPIDTNHLERALRVIPMGRKNWLFCWTEVGAQHVGIIQSLLTTCRLQGVDPYTYLVDVLQRVSLHPARAGRGPHAATLEGPVRRQSAALRSARVGSIAARTERLRLNVDSQERISPFHAQPSARLDGRLGKPDCRLRAYAGDVATSIGLSVGDRTDGAAGSRRDHEAQETAGQPGLQPGSATRRPTRKTWAGAFPYCETPMASILALLADWQMERCLNDRR